jgi:hypothetical protein
MPRDQARDRWETRGDIAGRPGERQLGRTGKRKLGPGERCRETRQETVGTHTRLETGERPGGRELDEEAKDATETSQETAELRCQAEGNWILGGTA